MGSFAIHAEVDYELKNDRNAFFCSIDCIICTELIKWAYFAITLLTEIMNLSWNSVNRERRLEQNVCDMRGAWFDSWSGHSLLSLRFFILFLCAYRKIVEYYRILGQSASLYFILIPWHANMLLSDAIKRSPLVIDYQKCVRNLRQANNQIQTRIRKNIVYKYG